MFCKLKTVVSFLRFIVTLLSLRPFGNNITIITARGAPWLRKYGDPSIGEILVLLLTSLYDRPVRPFNSSCKPAGEITRSYNPPILAGIMLSNGTKSSWKAWSLRFVALL